jgi:hypothetical protein
MIIQEKQFGFLKDLTMNNALYKFSVGNFMQPQ